MEETVIKLTKIDEFISNYSNHPVLFIGTGLSLRYLDDSYSWDELLLNVCKEFTGNEENYYDIKARHQLSNGEFDYPSIGSEIENLFNKHLINNRNGKFKYINDMYYELMKADKNVSRLKLYLSELFNNLSYKENVKTEISLLTKARKNIGSIITTNYDLLVEEIFGFNPLIGNDILLSNPYGSVYKIHGCSSDANKIIFTKEDYEEFNTKYELIRAQLLSLFTHNPIIFLGYSVSDDNIREILSTIFNYIDINSEMAEKVRQNFLLVEYEKDSINEDVVEHDIQLDDDKLIRINKLKTDNYSSLYMALNNLELPVSAMDIRKVQNVVKDIYSGGSIKVQITEGLDNLDNNEKILVVGSEKTIKYEFHTVPEIMQKYFEIIDEENKQLLNVIDKQVIQTSQFFPMYGFSLINNSIEKAEKLKKQQKNKLNSIVSELEPRFHRIHNSVEGIKKDNNISKSKEENVLVYNIMNGHISLDDVKEYLVSYTDTNTTSYKKLLCAYDFQKYGI